MKVKRSAEGKTGSDEGVEWFQNERNQKTVAKLPQRCCWGLPSTSLPNLSYGPHRCVATLISPQPAKLSLAFNRNRGDNRVNDNNN